MLPDDEEIQKLLALAKQGHEEKTENTLNDVHQFIIALNIKAGTEKVRCPEVWLLYLQWTKKPMHKQNFYIEFKKHFKIKYNSGWRYYLLDPTPFKFTEDRIWTINKYIRDERERKKRKNESKV